MLPIFKILFVRSLVEVPGGKKPRGNGWRNWKKLKRKMIVAIQRDLWVRYIQNRFTWLQTSIYTEHQPIPIRKRKNRYYKNNHHLCQLTTSVSYFDVINKSIFQPNHCWQLGIPNLQLHLKQERAKTKKKEVVSHPKPKGLVSTSCAEPF